MFLFLLFEKPCLAFHWLQAVHQHNHASLPPPIGWTARTCFLLADFCVAGSSWHSWGATYLLLFLPRRSAIRTVPSSGEIQYEYLESAYFLRISYFTVIVNVRAICQELFAICIAHNFLTRKMFKVTQLVSSHIHISSHLNWYTVVYHSVQKCLLTTQILVHFNLLKIKPTKCIKYKKAKVT